LSFETFLQPKRNENKRIPLAGASEPGIGTF
jgi:hypothetical protein